MVSHSNSDFLPPVQENEFLPPIGRWTTFGGLFIVCAVCSAIPVASVIKYKETVKAQATVRPAGELRIVQAATEGPVMRIFVKENQIVKKGDAIATIDDSILQTKNSQLQSSIQQAQLQLVQINAQISALNSQIRAETTRINRAVASAKAEHSGRSRDYLDRQLTAKADVTEASAHVRIAQEELQKAFAELRLAQASLKATEASLGAARSKRNRYQEVAKLGALSQDQFEEAQLSVKQQEQAVEGQKAAVLAQQETIERLEPEILAASAKRQRAIVALNPSNAEVAIAHERIAQEQATGFASIATLNKESSALIQQRIEISKQLERDLSELQQVNIDLKKTVIAATADGIVSKLNLLNPGQTVSAREEIAQIVPSNAPLVVKAAVAPEDKSKLKQGQNVHMRISACPYPDYGTLKGVVSQISSDTIKPQGNSVTTEIIASGQNGQAATAFYQVTIAPESLFLGRGKNQCTIQLGMEGSADIISREETVLKFLLRKARLSANV
jgi:multidrug efflux pump subunit AcrA (membrane-fusion protein)